MATQRNFEIKNGLSVAGTERIASNGDITGNHLGTFGGTTVTRSAGTNNTQLASTAYVDVAITNLIDSSPGALNTLNELAAALGDDANFSTTVTNSIATKLPLAGGTMSGALNMGGQNITNAAAITSTGNITSGNDVFVPNGRFFRFTSASSSSSGGFLFGDTSGTGGSIAFKRNSDSASVLTLNGDTSATFTGDVIIEKSGNPSFTVKTTGAGNNPFLKLQAATNYWEFLGIFSNGDDDLDIRYNGSSKLEIDNSGNATFAGTISSGSNPVVLGGVSNAANLTITGVMQANNGYKVGSTTVIDSNRNLSSINLKQLRDHNDSMYISPTNPNTLNGNWNDASDDGDMWINYRGYQDGTNYFRNLRIGNGKMNGLLHVDGSSREFQYYFDSVYGQVIINQNNTTSGQNYLTAGECFPLVLRNLNATNAVKATTAISFGHEAGSYGNFVGSQKVGTGGTASAELVFGGRQTNGASFTEWGRWHTDGNLEKPYQSSFHASSTSTVVTLSSGSSLMISNNFNKVNGTAQHNIGSDYDTSTGIYTAPVDGRYLFSYNLRWEIASYTVSNYHRSYISVNDVNDYEAAHCIWGSDSPVTNYFFTSGSVVLELSTGDTVRLKGGQESYTSKVYFGESGWSGAYLG